MEAILAMPSPDRGREFVLPLSLGGVRVRTVVQTGNQLVAELSREPADCVFLPEVLPDGPAEMWLAKAAVVAPRRPVAVVLVYGVEAAETVRERVRGAYGPGADVVAAGARTAEDVATEVTRLVERLARTAQEQDLDAFERLKQPVAPGPVPQPVHRGGALAFLGSSGGVGTSCLVANLAAYAAMAGQRVLVVDAQFATAGSVLYYLGVEADDHNRGMHHLRWTQMSAGGAVRDGAVDELMQRLEDVRLRGVRHADLRVLHVPAMLEAMAGIPADHVLWAMQTLARSFDLMLVDCGSGFGDPRTQKLLESASRVLLVTGGWGASVQALVRALLALAGKAGAAADREHMFLLLREAEGVYGARTVHSLANMPIYGRLPEEPLLRKADARLGARLPLVVEAPEAPYARGVAQLAFAMGVVEQLDGKAKAAARRKGWRALFGAR